jgi:hypothetical protein
MIICFLHEYILKCWVFFLLWISVHRAYTARICGTEYLLKIKNIILMQQENTISLIMFSLKWETTLYKKREKLCVCINCDVKYGLKCQHAIEWCIVSHHLFNWFSWKIRKNQIRYNLFIIPEFRIMFSLKWETTLSKKREKLVFN